MPKPYFIFFKKVGCPSCDRFFENVYRELQSDGELLSKVQFVCREFGAPRDIEYVARGSDAVQTYRDGGRAGDSILFKLDDKRSERELRDAVNEMVKYVPYFVLYYKEDSKIVQLSNNESPSKDAIFFDLSRARQFILTAVADSAKREGRKKRVTLPLDTTPITKLRKIANARDE